MSNYNPDLSKTNKELFEEFYQNNETAVSKFNTWYESENLYTDPELCFHWQMFQILIESKRAIKILEDKVGDKT